MKELSERARLLLGRYKTVESLSSAHQERLVAKLENAVARGTSPQFDDDVAAPIAVPLSWPQRAWSAPLFRPLILIFLVALPAVAAMGIVSRLTPARVVPPPAPTRLAPAGPAAPRPAIEATASEIAPVVAPAPSVAPKHPAARSSTRAASPRIAQAPAIDATIDGEMRLLKEAQAANSDGNWQRALRLLDEYALRFPSGRLAGRWRGRPPNRPLQTGADNHGAVRSGTLSRSIPELAVHRPGKEGLRRGGRSLMLRSSRSARAPLLCTAAAALIGHGSGCSNTAAQGTVGVYLPDSIALSMLIRDFKKYDANDPTTNPAFHNNQVHDNELDVVADTLGTDGKPTYKTPANNLPTFGKQYFDQWYHDIPGTNTAVSYPINLTANSDGLLAYDCRQTGTPDMSTGTPRLLFLPIDDGTPHMTAFGDQGDRHNFAFTGELHALFTYPGQGVFKFRSDDDLYVFIGGTLIAAASAPGQHVAEETMLDVTALGLTAGREYTLDVFYAERAGAAGDFMMATSVVLRAAP